MKIKAHGIVLVTLALLMLSAVAGAVHQVQVPFSIVTEKDGFNYTQHESYNISVADSPPDLEFKVAAYKIVNGTYVPYTGVFSPDDIIQMNVQVRVKSGQPCADRVSVFAPAFDPETQTVVNTLVLEVVGRPVCYGPWYGAHWMWWSGIPPIG